MSGSKVEIVIPIYKETLSNYEQKSLDRCFKVLYDYAIVMCKPNGLNTQALEKKYSFARTECFEPSFFDSIAGYNRLMMDASFYDRFIHVEYILIFQPDVFIFYDNLSYWIEQGYDYVGAPWIYKHYLGKCLQWIKMKIADVFYKDKGVIHKFEAKGKVGNGGFSLRKTRIHKELCFLLRSDMERFLKEQDKYYFNEDLYWSIIPNRKGYTYRTPDWREAVSFAFDHNPKELYKINGQQLPMAAHGWFTRKNILFWEPIIRDLEQVTT